MTTVYAIVEAGGEHEYVVMLAADVDTAKAWCKHWWPEHGEWRPVGSKTGSFEAIVPDGAMVDTEMCDLLLLIRAMRVRDDRPEKRERDAKDG